MDVGEVEDHSHLVGAQSKVKTLKMKAPPRKTMMMTRASPVENEDITRVIAGTMINTSRRARRGQTSARSKCLL